MFRKTSVVPVFVLLIALTALVALPASAAAAGTSARSAAAIADAPAWPGAGILNFTRAALGWLQTIVPGAEDGAAVRAHADAARSAPTQTAEEETWSSTKRQSVIDPDG